MSYDQVMMTILAPLIIAILASVRKIPGFEPFTWTIPFMAMTLGLLGALLFRASQAPEQMMSLATMVISGLASGLSAVGLFEAGKNVIKRE